MNYQGLPARYADDRHFPNSVWGEPLRASAAREIPREAIVTALQELLAR